MSDEKNLDSLFNGFSKLDYQDRLERLRDAGLIVEDDMAFLADGGVKDIVLSENFIENAIGYFQLPLGVATHFRIDGVDRFVPMAVEETSIIAAASKTAKWIKENGEIKTSVMGSEIIGQIQLARVGDFTKFESLIERNKSHFIEMANREVVPSLVARGGGVRSIQVRKLVRPDGLFMGIVHVYMDPCEAMGANLINQVCEFLKNPIQELTGEKVTMCILSNLVDSKVTNAHIKIKVDAELGEKIEEASLFAELDPYRAATNNKGILNGIDPIVIATGNDWRAVEAGMHAYVARTGHYTSLSRWRYQGGLLQGQLNSPIIMGTVGGVTRLHPTSKLALKILNVESSNDLSRVCAAVGLTQNLGALRALTTVGIIEGHMKLHIKNLSMGAGATDSEIPILQKKLEQILVMRKRITLSNAVEALREIRAPQQ
ncbi:MAG: hydroxymethylglutaryl-CoA reductase, degradative [Bdellovibrionaceae bacterium]|nr:hydroxymethylglutaryl-CoA reductase, degradative [Pseudobdellovibrionaceae bacterium]